MSDIERAMEIALSCRRCGNPTDAEFHSKTASWVTYCDCGKTDKHLGKEVDEEAKRLAETLPKNRH
jgi:hypothetical protein